MYTNRSWVISFDIGIKNLAYCIFDKIHREVIDWNVLDISKFQSETTNIVKTEGSVITCTCLLSNKKNTCKKKAKYQKGDFRFCEQHAKEKTCDKAGGERGFYLPKKEFQIKWIQKQKMDFLADFEKTYLFLNLDLSTVSLLKKGKTERLAIIEKWIQEKVLDHISLEEPKNEKKGEIGLVEIGRNMANQLSLLDMSKIDTVLIENQISPIANKMKTIQGMLAQIFILQSVPNIEFISSRNKLKGYEKDMTSKDSLEKEVNKDTTVKDTSEKDMTITKEKPNKYKQNKKDGIQYCKQLFSSENPPVKIDTKWKTFFETYPKKQDDLADAFLQGLWYLSNKKEKGEK